MHLARLKSASDPSIALWTKSMAPAASESLSMSSCGCARGIGEAGPASQSTSLIGEYRHGGGSGRDHLRIRDTCSAKQEELIDCEGYVPRH